MKARDKEIAEDLHKYAERLNYESQEGAIVIVEGKRDERALRAIGYDGEVITLCNGKGIGFLADKLSLCSKIILLFDLDRKGRYLTKRFMLLLEGRARKVDLTYRKELLNITKGRIRQIEELNSLIQTTEEFKV